RLERLQRIVSKLQMESGLCEEQLNQADTLLQSDIRLLNAGKPPQKAAEIERDLDKADAMIRLLFNDVQTLKDGRHPQGEQMYRRGSGMEVQDMGETFWDGGAGHGGRGSRMEVRDVRADVLRWRCRTSREMFWDGCAGHWRRSSEMDVQDVEGDVLGWRCGMWWQVFWGAGCGTQPIPAPRPQNSSKARLRHLESLHGFVSAATKELMWLNEKEEEEVNFDWSDHNPNMMAKKENYS
ncbi:Plectin, partial [Struthio camelus australis]